MTIVIGVGNPDRGDDAAGIAVARLVKAIAVRRDLTVVELGDEFLLQELEAVTDLRGATIHVFSPRLLAIDAARVPSLVAAMTKAGHRPRLVESA